MRWRSLPASPATFWVRWVLSSSPPGPERTVDLATRTLRSPAGSRRHLRRAELSLPRTLDLVLLEAQEESVASRLEQEGFPILRRVTPGAPGGARGHCLLDLADAVWNGDRDLRRPLEATALWVLFPLFPGFDIGSGGPLGGWIERLLSLDAEAVLPFPVDLRPRERRAWAERLGEEHFEAVFHRDPAPIREVARAFARAGLSIFPELPCVERSSRRERERRELVARLAEVAFLLGEMGISERETQELWQSARKLEESELDLAAVAREGNLGVVSWLSPAARRWIERFVTQGAEATIGAVRARFVNSSEESDP